VLSSLVRDRHTYRDACVSATGADGLNCFDCCNFAAGISLVELVRWWCHGVCWYCMMGAAAGVEPVGGVRLLASLLSGSFDLVGQVSKTGAGEVQSAQRCAWLWLDLH
jgi:hypothetical protein